MLRVPIIVSLLTLLGGAGSAPAPSTLWNPPPIQWLGSRSASVAQDAVAVIDAPAAFANANLLVALVATDGPDTYPKTNIKSETTAVFGGDERLHWIRAAHVSARHDVGDALQQYGASVAEVWTAAPPADWGAGSTITVTTTHPNHVDDGMAVTIVAFANATLTRTATIDGLAGQPEYTNVAVPDHAAVYAATFAGRVNATFTPTTGYHRVKQRRAGDDTAGIVASDSHDLPAGVQTVGYTSPDPGNFWEVAVAVVAPAS